MRAFWSLSMAMLKGFYRDKVSLFFTILFPLFFIVIFGTIFANDNAARPKVIEVGSVPFIDTLPAEARAEFDRVIDLVPGTTLDAALQEVQKGDAGAAVEQQQNTLLLHYTSADPVVAGTVQGTFSAFVDQTNIQLSGVPPTYTLQTAQVEDESLQPIQYIAPGMIGYGIAVGAVFGAALTLITWREKKLLRRLRLAPVSTASVVGSRVSVSMAVAIGQLILFVGISVLPFLGLKLSGAWYMAIPLVMAGTLAFLAIGLLVGSVAKTAEGGSGLANLITLPMAFLSGAFIPLESAPAWLVTISKFLPMGYLVEGMKDVMVRGEPASAAFLPIVILLGFAVVITAVATRVFKWDTARDSCKVAGRPAHLGEQRGELLEFLVVQPDQPEVGRRHRGRRVQQAGPAGLGELDQGGAPIGRVRQSAREAVGFEPVDDVGDRRRVQLQPFAHQPHRQRPALGEGQQHQRLVAGEGQAVRLEALVDGGLQDLLDPHHVGDRRHRRVRTDAFRPGLRCFGNGIEGQRGCWDVRGHGSTVAQHGDALAPAAGTAGNPIMLGGPTIGYPGIRGP